MDEHEWRKRFADSQDVTHACPECIIGHPRPFCSVCLGAGVVTVQRLARYELEQRHRLE